MKRIRSNTARGPWGAHVACAAAFLFAGAPEASAAEGETDEERGGAPHAAVPLDTVSVSGSRFANDPLDIPMATTDVPRAEIGAGRNFGLDEGLDLIPGVIAQSRAGGQDVRITIRGFGARGAGDRSNAGTTRGIRILLDGFPITEPDGRSSLDLADLGFADKLRIIRTNASTLFGSASGGLIDVSTNTGFTSPFVDVGASGGSFGFKRTLGNFGFRAGAARMKLSAGVTRNDGWRDHSESEATLGQGSAVIEASSRTSIGVFLTGGRTIHQQPGALTREEMEADPRSANPTYVDQNSRRDNRLGRIGARLKHAIDLNQRFEFGTFVEPKSLHRSERNRYRDFQRVHAGGTGSYAYDHPFSDNNLAAFRVGFDEAYQDGSVLFYSLGPNGTRGDELIADQREGINTFGLFGEARVDFSERWEFTLGSRYDWVHYISEDHMQPELSASRTLEHATPRIAASYRVNPRHALYAAISTGLETPAFNEVDPPAPFDTVSTLNPLLEPAYSLTEEIGAKGTFPLGESGTSHFGYDVALYHLEVENDIIPFDGGAYYLTAGKSRRYGLELAGDFATSPGISARLAVTLSHNEYLEYENQLGNFEGNESAGIPPVAIDAKLRYDTQGGLYLEGFGRRIGAYYADDANSDAAKVDAFNTFDVTAGYDRPVSGTRLGLFVGVHNVTDEEYVASVFINGVDGRFFEPGMERNVVAGLTVRGDVGGGGESSD